MCPSVRPSIGRSVRPSVGHTPVETTQKCHFCTSKNASYGRVSGFFFCIVDFLSTIIFRQIVFSKSFIPSPFFSVDFLSVRFFPGSIFLSMSIFLFLNRVIHATFRLSLDFKSAGKNIHDLSITSLASFTPLVVPY